MSSDSGLSKRQAAFFRTAKNMSTLSDFPGVRIGAVVVNKHKIISSGYNSKSRCHRLQAELNQKRFNTPSRGEIHAELDALLPLINKVDLTNAQLYVYREYKDGALAPCRPCKSCMSVIRHCGIKKIFYTTKDGYVEETLQY